MRKGYRTVPTAAQIAFVEDIKGCLGITDFPTCAAHYSKASYSNFIETHQDEFYCAIGPTEEDLNDLGLYTNDAWCEYY